MNNYNIDDEIFFIDFTIEGGRLKKDVIRLIKKENDIIWYEVLAGILIKESGIICKGDNKNYALQYFTGAINLRLQETASFIESI